MKKIYFIFILLLLGTIFVLAETQKQSPNLNDETKNTQQQKITEVQSNNSGFNKPQIENRVEQATQTNNQGENLTLRNKIQVRLKEGRYTNSQGQFVEFKNENGLKLKVGQTEAKSDIELEGEVDEQNKTTIRAKLSNGKYSEIKVMPNTASERATERLRLKVCSEENNCTIQLKEVSNGTSVKAAYEVKAEKQSRLLFLFKKKMNVQAQIDAETGEVIQVKKPWWAFLAKE